MKQGVYFLGGDGYKSTIYVDQHGYAAYCKHSLDLYLLNGGVWKLEDSEDPQLEDYSKIIHGDFIKW